MMSLMDFTGAASSVLDKPSDADEKKKKTSEMKKKRRKKLLNKKVNESEPSKKLPSHHKKAQDLTGIAAPPGAPSGGEENISTPSFVIRMALMF